MIYATLQWTTCSNTLRKTEYANYSHFSQRTYDELTSREKDVSVIENFLFVRIHMLNKYPERKYESELHIVCFIVVLGNDWLLLLTNIFNQLYILKMGISFQRNEEKQINNV